MCPDKTLPSARREVEDRFSDLRARTLGGATFRLTSCACPEQYDVDLGEAENRGYVRLRHGELRADYLPDGDFDRAVTVFEHDIDDDAPCFESNEERDQYLTQIAEALYRHHRTAAREPGSPQSPDRGANDSPGPD